jgi:hypothetical protein
MITTPPRRGAAGLYDRLIGPGAFGGTNAALAPAGWRWLPPAPAFKLVAGHATPDGPLVALVDRVEGAST